MSQETVEVALKALEAWNSGDFETALDLVDPKIEVEVSLHSPLDGIYRGHEGLTHFLTEFWGQFGTFRTELDDCIPIGDDDVVLGVQRHGTGRVSGVVVEVPGWQVATVRAGRMVRWRNFRTREEALNAVGVRE